MFSFHLVGSGDITLVFKSTWELKKQWVLLPVELSLALALPFKKDPSRAGETA